MSGAHCSSKNTSIRLPREFRKKSPCTANSIYEVDISRAGGCAFVLGVCVWRSQAVPVLIDSETYVMCKLVGRGIHETVYPNA